MLMRQNVNNDVSKDRPIPASGSIFVRRALNKSPPPSPIIPHPLTPPLQNFNVGYTVLGQGMSRKHRLRKRRPQTSKTQTSKTQTSKTQTSKTQTSKTQTSKMQTSKTQTSKTQTSKTQTSKTQTSKTQTLKTQTFKSLSSSFLFLLLFAV